MRKLAALIGLFLLLTWGSTFQRVYADSDNEAVLGAVLWIGDIDNGRIWVVDLDKRKILTSYQSPSQEGSPRFPIGLALLRGRLFVNNFNFNFDCKTGNEIFSLEKWTGEVMGSTSVPACALDGMAAVPEAGMLLAIDSGSDPEQLLLLKPRQTINGLVLQKVGAIDIDVPGVAVRGLAYQNGRIFVATETEGSSGCAVNSDIFIYRLSLKEMDVSPKGRISLGCGLASPGLATYGNSLVAYRIEDSSLLVVQSKNGGRILKTISLQGTPIGGVGALEAKVHPDAYDELTE